MGNKLLIGEHLAKTFHRDSERIRAVVDVDIDVDETEIHGIIGESGCGKSTLARILVGLEEEYEGRVYFDEEEIGTLLKKSRKDFYRTIQMIFQNPYDVFDPRHRLGKSLSFVLKLHKIGKDDAERFAMISQVMEDMGFRNVSDIFARRPSELSGGQLQRLAILRSLLLHPRMLVGDEITAMLDVSVRAEIINTLLRVIEEYDMSMVLISHDIMSIRVVADRISVMYLGEIVESGSVGDIFKEPLHPYTRTLVSNCRDVNPMHSVSPIRLKSEEKKIRSEQSCFFVNRCPYAIHRCHREHPTMKRQAGRSVRCFLFEP